MSYYEVATEAGQTLYDISIQEYGSVHYTRWLVQDNPTMVPHRAGARSASADAAG